MVMCLNYKLIKEDHKQKYNHHNLEKLLKMRVIVIVVKFW